MQLALAHAGLASLALAACAAPAHRSQSHDRALDSWFSVGVENVDPDVGYVAMSEATGFSLEGGHFLQRDEHSAWGWEGWLRYSRHDASYYDPSLDVFHVEEPANVMLGGGARVAWSVLGDSLVPYVRGGVLYQYVFDYRIDDAGPGLYLGGGVDVRVTDHVSVGPQLLYTTATLTDFDVDQLVLGVKVGFSF